MTFAEFKTKVLADAFPLGVPENLTEAIDQYVISGMIEAQRWVKCYRYRHEDVVPACNTYWHCGLTVATSPRGKILRAYTVEKDLTTGKPAWCFPVVLTPVPMPELRRWQAAFRLRWNRDMYQPPNSGRDIPMGFDVPTVNSDAISGRSFTGVYALDGTACRLYIAPWLQTTEAVVIEWQGIKRAWSDLDPVSDDQDYRRLIRLFVEVEYGRKWASPDLMIREKSWADCLADQMATCEEETKLHGEPRSAEEADIAAFGAFVAPSTAVPEPAPPDDQVVVSFVGDYGDGGTNAIAVADALQAEEPTLIVTLGNNKVGSAQIGMAPYAESIDLDKLHAALGNLDLDDGALGSDVTTRANNPGNGRYFTVKVGPVTLFVLDSGLQSDGTLVEPDGNTAGSKQWQEAVAAIVRDTSHWKIVVIHHPPHTSGASTSPGVASVAWVSGLPVHAVLSAHSRNYERLNISGRLHLVAGTGGLPLEGFASPVAGSELRLSEFGYLRLTASCASARLDFVALDGTVGDAVDLVPDVEASPTFVPVLAIPLGVPLFGPVHNPLVPQ